MSSVLYANELPSSILATGHREISSAEESQELADSLEFPAQESMMVQWWSVILSPRYGAESQTSVAS